MPESKRLNALRERIQLQDGTVLEKVEGEVEVDDKDKDGNPRTGPVLVLQGIEEGAQLKLATPRPVTVLGHISGQVFGAFRVKAGSLLSGRLEGARQVDIVYNMASKGKSNVDSWIVFEGTSDPNFFAQADESLELLNVLKNYKSEQSEKAAFGLLCRSVKTVPYHMQFSVPVKGESLQVFSLNPSHRSKPVVFKSIALLRYILASIEEETMRSTPEEKLVVFQQHLAETVLQGLYGANQGGHGSSLRQQQGSDIFEPYAELIYSYVFPVLLKTWLKFEVDLLQRIVDNLSKTPMVLKVEGQLAPFWQIEYPHWKFFVKNGKIESEKIADCNIACQAGSSPETMSLTYNYVGEDDWLSQTKEIPLEQTKNCCLILKDGHAYLNELDNCLFGAEAQEPEEAPASGQSA